MRITDDDIQELIDEMKKRPPKASLGHGIYKFEWWPSRFNLGKKEGRVIYVEYVEGERVYLFALFPKNEKADLNSSEKDIIIKYVDTVIKKK